MPQRFVFRGLWHLRRFDLFPKLLNFFDEVVAFAKLGLNSLHLLPQIKLALGPINVRARLGIDFLLNGEHFDFLIQQFVNTPQPRRRVRDLQDRLRILDFQFQV